MSHASVARLPGAVWVGRAGVSTRARRDVPALRASRCLGDVRNLRARREDDKAPRRRVDRGAAARRDVVAIASPPSWGAWNPTPSTTDVVPGGLASSLPTNPSAPSSSSARSSRRGVATRALPFALAPVLVARALLAFMWSSIAAVLADRALSLAIFGTCAVLIALTAVRYAGFKPRVTLSRSTRMAALVAASPTIHRPLRPPLLLQWSVTQLAAYLLKQKFVPNVTWRRTLLDTPDGGEIALDWYQGCDADDAKGLRQPNRLRDDAPIVCVMHTLTGVADDFVMLARAATRRGFRIVVMLRRGHLGRPLRTPRFNLLGCVDDLRVHLDGIQAEFPNAPLFGYGESAGTGLAVRYSGESGKKNRFAAVACVCPGYDTTEGGAFSRFEPLLDKHLLLSVKNMFLRANERLLMSASGLTPSYVECMAAPDMAELQRRLFGIEGYPSLEAYHSATNPMGPVEGIAAPLLVINSDDDPICAPSNVDDNLHAFDVTAPRALVRTPVGTHCCFYEGKTITPRSSWAHDACLDFFVAVCDEPRYERRRRPKGKRVSKRPRRKPMGVDNNAVELKKPAPTLVGAGGNERIKAGDIKPVARSVRFSVDAEPKRRNRGRGSGHSPSMPKDGMDRR